jgi:hypothetical protein
MDSAKRNNQKILSQPGSSSGSRSSSTRSTFQLLLWPLQLPEMQKGVLVTPDAYALGTQQQPPLLKTTAGTQFNQP